MLCCYFFHWDGSFSLILFSILLFISFSSLFVCTKQQRSKSKFRGKKKHHPGIVEVKAVIQLSYYVAIMLLYLIAFSTIFYTFPQYQAELKAYIRCEALGNLPSFRCSRYPFERFHFPIIAVVGLILLWLFPAGNLVYVVSVEAIKKSYKKQVSKLRSFSERYSNTTGSVSGNVWSHSL